MVDVRHIYLYCPKEEQRRHTLVCQQKQCAWLVTGGGTVECRFVPKSMRRAREYIKRRGV